MYSVDLTREELLFLRELVYRAIMQDEKAGEMPIELYTSLEAIDRAVR